MPTLPAAAGLTRQQRAAYRNAADRRRYGQGQDLSQSLTVTSAQGQPLSSSGLMGFANAWTIGLWVRVRSASGRSIFQVDGAGSVVNIGQTSPGSLAVNLENPSGTLFKNYRTFPGTFPLDEWHLVGGRWDGESLRLIFDGLVPDASVAKLTDDPDSMDDQARSIIFGGGGAGYQVDMTAGEINQAFIFDVPLSGGAIQALYFQGKGRLVDLRYPFGEYAEVTHLRHYWRPGEDPQVIGRDYGRNQVAHDVSDPNYDANDLTFASPF